MKFDKVKYDNKFQKDNYDRIALNVKKGEKDIIANFAKEKGYTSITEYIKSLIYKDMQGNKNITVGDISQTGDNNSVHIG